MFSCGATNTCSRFICCFSTIAISHVGDHGCSSTIGVENHSHSLFGYASSTRIKDLSFSRLTCTSSLCTNCAYNVGECNLSIFSYYKIYLWMVYMVVVRSSCSTTLHILVFLCLKMTTSTSSSSLYWNVIFYSSFCSLLSICGSTLGEKLNDLRGLLDFCNLSVNYIAFCGSQHMISMVGMFVAMTSPSNCSPRNQCCIITLKTNENLHVSFLASNFPFPSIILVWTLGWKQLRGAKNVVTLYFF